MPPWEEKFEARRQDLTANSHTSEGMSSGRRRAHISFRVSDVTMQIFLSSALYDGTQHSDKTAECVQRDIGAAMLGTVSTCRRSRTTGKTCTYTIRQPWVTHDRCGTRCAGTLYGTLTIHCIPSYLHHCEIRRNMVEHVDVCKMRSQATQQRVRSAKPQRVVQQATRGRMRKLKMWYADRSKVGSNSSNMRHIKDNTVPKSFWPLCGRGQPHSVPKLENACSPRDHTFQGRRQHTNVAASRSHRFRVMELDTDTRTDCHERERQSVESGAFFRCQNDHKSTSNRPRTDSGASRHEHHIRELS